MKLESEQLTELREIACRAAEAAGAYIQSRAGGDYEVERKKGGDTLASQVVTEVDRKAQDIILAELKDSIDRYNLAVLSEESADDGSRLRKDYFWCIDPLDGTLAFTEGESGYAVVIALVARSGEPMIGVIFDPIESVLYDGLKGEGLRRSGQSWDPLGKATRKEVFHFVSDRSLLKQPNFPEIEKAMECFCEAEGYERFERRSHGGGAMNAIWALESGSGTYFKFPKEVEGGGSLWDFAASSCIYNEAGAIATNVYGGDLELNREDTTFMNRGGVLFATDLRIAEMARSLVEKWHANA